MRKKFNATVLTRPLVYQGVISVSSGETQQIYDNISGTYTPDRSKSATVLEMGVTATNPNDGTTSTPTVTSAIWYLALPTGTDGALVEEQITSSTTGFALSSTGSVLTITRNIAYGLSGATVRCVAQFKDPVTGNSARAEDSLELTTALNTAANLSLLKEQPSTTGYAGDVYLVNPLVTPLNTAGDNWKVNCRCQLCDGTVKLDAAYTSDGSDVRTGSAFYFWYLKDRKGNLSRLREGDNDWFTCSEYGDGTQAQECTVDLAKAYGRTLVCKAGFVPYGEYADYLESDGTISPSKCKYGFLRQDFDLRVALPKLDRIEVVSLSYDRIPVELFKDTSNTIIRHCMVTAGGTCLDPDPSDTTFCESLFDIVWYAVINGTETVVGNGATLTVSLATLGATSADTLPEMSVEVTPKYPDLFGDNYVVGYNASSDDVIPIEKHGDASFLKQLDFMLVDTTTEEDGTFLAYLLQRNNLFRYANGSYATTVGITSDMESECKDNTLYSDAACTTVAYAAGTYGNGTKEWEQQDKALMAAGGSPRTLYRKDSNGNITAVSHKLRPWETTRTDLTIGVGFPFAVYLLDQVKGDSGTVWKGIFTDVTEWDGIDLTPYKLEPTAMSPGAFCTVGGKARDFFYLYEGENNCAGEAGNGRFITAFKGGRTYPRSSDVNQVTSMTYCRASNKDTTSPVPMAEGGYHCLNTLITAVELFANTKYLYNADLFGSGISSHDDCNASTFYKNGGVKWKKSSATSYTYNTWGTTKSATVGGTTMSATWSQITTNERAKAQCMEAQMAASMAVELGIAATTASGSEHTFKMYDGTYYWMAAGSLTGPADGLLNCRVYKIVTTSYTDDNDGEIDIEYRLRMSLYMGMELAGDVLRYCGGGAELVATAVNKSDDNKYGNTINGFYLQPSQKDWKRITAVQVAAGSTFSFEDSYLTPITESDGLVTVSNNWRKNRKSYSPFSVTSSSSNKGDCMYIWNENRFDTSASGKKTRLALLFGHAAYAAACAPRALYCNFPASAAHRTYAGRAQAIVRLSQ